MNILPKKSWHVLSRDNIQRVRRDEAEARAQEEARQQRVDLAEKELRLSYMRKEARKREGVSNEVSSSEGVVTIVSGGATDRHVNLFSDLQHGVGLQALKNKEHEKEEMKEKESFEKRVGILNYLVDKDKPDDPWYIRDKKKEEEIVQAKRKNLEDPMTAVKQLLGKKRKVLEESTSKSSHKVNRSAAMAGPPQAESSSTRTKSSHKKHKTRKRGPSTDLEKLRKERKQREEAEKVRSEALLSQYYGLGHDKAGTSASGEPVPSRKYNSQFNPHLAKQ